MSQTPLQLQEQMVAHWREMDAEHRYSTRKRSREDAPEEARTRSKTLDDGDVNTSVGLGHETQSTPAPRQSA